MDGTGAHQGGAEDHQTGVEDHHGGAQDLHGRAGGAEDHQTGAEDHHGGADGTATPGRDWDLGKTETRETEKACTDSRTKAGNIGSPSIFSLVATERADSP